MHRTYGDHLSVIIEFFFILFIQASRFICQSYARVPINMEYLCNIILSP